MKSRHKETIKDPSIMDIVEQHLPNTGPPPDRCSFTFGTPMADQLRPEVGDCKLALTVVRSRIYFTWVDSSSPVFVVARLALHASVFSIE